MPQHNIQNVNVSLYFLLFVLQFCSAGSMGLSRSSVDLQKRRDSSIATHLRRVEEMKRGGTTAAPGAG